MLIYFRNKKTDEKSSKVTLKTSREYKRNIGKQINSLSPKLALKLINKNNNAKGYRALSAETIKKNVVKGHSEEQSRKNSRTSQEKNNIRHKDPKTVSELHELYKTYYDKKRELQKQNIKKNTLDSCEVIANIKTNNRRQIRTSASIYDKNHINNQASSYYINGKTQKFLSASDFDMNVSVSTPQKIKNNPNLYAKLCLFTGSPPKSTMKKGVQLAELKNKILKALSYLVKQNHILKEENQRMKIEMAKLKEKIVQQKNKQI